MTATTEPDPAPGTASHASIGSACGGEAADLLEALANARHFLRHTVREMSDEQARRRTTVSELTLGGLIKHVTDAERRWAGFLVDGPSVFPDITNATEADWEEFAATFRMREHDTLAGVLADYERVAERTEQLVRGLADLDTTQPLPPAPWSTPGARWSARRVLLHITAETAQHAGHADILRESIDGQKSMG